jgi:thiazole synthase
MVNYFSMNTATDIVIVGGGVIGLAIAFELRLRGLAVTVLSRDVQQAASHAAAGMLVPQAEAIPPGPLLDLCLESRTRYPEWISKIEDTSGIATGYWTCGSLVPIYMKGEGYLAAPNIPHFSAFGQWLDHDAIRYAQPGLSDEVGGGWWFPEDGQVDNRALMQALQTAAQAVGVNVQEGVTVTAIEQHDGRVIGLKTTVGSWQAKHYVLATGAWAHDLLPVPVQPKKGQILALSLPLSYAELPLKRVLFGEEIYIVPRQDGRILLGATSEWVGFTPYNTAAGIQTLLHAAIRLYPCLRDFPVQECWWGFRPTTPDEMPILGASPCENLILALGHYRNGILLAPVTARLIADLICQQQTDALLAHFSWERFIKARSPLQPASSKIAERPDSTAELTVKTLDSLITQPPDLKPADSPLAIAGRTFQSRLMTGTGKYRNFDEMRHSIAASGSQIVTVAVRRVQTNAPGHQGLADALDWTKLWMLPNTAGCQTAEDAIRVARLGREMAKLLGQEDNNFVKLEVIPDPKYLLPDPIGTLEAAEQLVKEGFAVLPYINADPLLAKRLEEVGCVTVMPLGSPIGSGQGIRNGANIQIIIENATVPIVVDAGIGIPSEAAQAMEMGADALLINTAIAQAQDPVKMGRAMGMATEAGRLAYLAGRIPVKSYASASSPLTGTITS